jgi:hypothetical protein
METQFCRAFAVISLIFLLACGQSVQLSSTPIINSGGGSNGNQSQNTPLQICSQLDFTQVTWPTSMTAADRNALALALNISGSYEGETGWANLTNNFDGQGVSMGLLNQNLGQGSLQPMLINMRDNFLKKMQSIFSSADLTNLLGMLARWEADQPQVKVLPRINILDFKPLGDAAVAVSPETTSVQWAVANLYIGNSFDPVWAKELNALAESSQYISIQVQAAMNMHNVSISEISKIGVHELRTYLMFFDIEVQDGNVYAADFADYATWVALNAHSSDTERLVELLNLRLRHVNPSFVPDVQSRKMAIINGSGVVHGTNRNLQSQYCYNGLSAFH